MLLKAFCLACTLFLDHRNQEFFCSSPQDPLSSPISVFWMLTDDMKLCSLSLDYLYNYLLSAISIIVFFIFLRCLLLDFWAWNELYPYTEQSSKRLSSGSLGIWLVMLSVCMLTDCLDAAPFRPWINLMLTHRISILTGSNFQITSRVELMGQKLSCNFNAYECCQLSSKELMKIVIFDSDLSGILLFLLFASIRNY